MYYIYIYIYHIYVLYCIINIYNKCIPPLIAGGALGVLILECQIWFWGPRPLQNEEPTKNTYKCSLSKIRAPNPLLHRALL